jgi:hypothetical protein
MRGAARFSQTDETATGPGNPDGKTASVVRATVRRTTVTPVATATNTPDRPINVGRIPKAIAITPADGG